jgi:hypothetical protein
MRKIVDNHGNLTSNNGLMRLTGSEWDLMGISPTPSFHCSGRSIGVKIVENPEPSSSPPTGNGWDSECV